MAFSGKFLPRETKTEKHSSVAPQAPKGLDFAVLPLEAGCSGPAVVSLPCLFVPGSHSYFLPLLISDPASCPRPAPRPIVTAWALLESTFMPAPSCQQDQARRVSAR